MKLVEVSGDALTIGQSTGEELREEIRMHLELFPFPPGQTASWERRAPAFLTALRHHIPLVLEEMEGTAQGADVPLRDILQLNLPMYANALVVGEGCTNIAFATGPDGPIWGKNNDGGPPDKRRPVCARLVRRDDGIPQVNFTFCGMLATLDAMNAEGLAMGHSSVGSVYQQSDHHIPIRLWGYECLMRSRNLGEFVSNLASVPLRGKGYSVLCVDRDGAMCSIEAPCPLIQVRGPNEGQPFMNCVNYYQLPQLAEADRRPESGKLNAKVRERLLEQMPADQDVLDLQAMKRILRHHGDPSFCRHGGDDQDYTEYSMIGLPQSGRVLYLDGCPCEEQFQEITL